MLKWAHAIFRQWFTRAPTYLELVLVSIGSDGLPQVVARLKVKPVELIDDHVVVVVRLQSILEQLAKE